MKTLDTLLATLPQTGTVTWIGLRPARRARMEDVNQVRATPNEGLVGDRYSGRSGKRHVTLIMAEHLDAIASCLALEQVSPTALRRNLVVRGINLHALKEKTICVGEVALEITGICHPCSLMEKTFGPGGYNAVRGHGGVTARVVSEGVIYLGDEVAIAIDST